MPSPVGPNIVAFIRELRAFNLDHVANDIIQRLKLAPAIARSPRQLSRRISEYDLDEQAKIVAEAVRHHLKDPFQMFTLARDSFREIADNKISLIVYDESSQVARPAYDDKGENDIITFINRFDEFVDFLRTPPNPGSAPQGPQGGSPQQGPSPRNPGRGPSGASQSTNPSSSVNTRTPRQSNPDPTSTDEEPEAAPDIIPRPSPA